LNKSAQADYDTYKWYVPFTYTTKTELNFSFETKPVWLTPSQDKLIVQLANNSTNSTWVIANLKQAGFYRVNYDINNWNLLIEQLHTDHTLIDSQSRAQLIEDSFNLGRGELIDQSVFLRLVSYLVKEEDPLPIMAAIRGLDFIQDMLSTNYIGNLMFKEFYKRSMLPVYEKYGWRMDVEDINEVSLQIKAVEIMCFNGMPECVEHSQGLFNEWIEKNETEALTVFEDDFTRIALCTAVMYGNDSFSKVESRRFYSLLGYMACSRDLNTLRLILRLSEDEVVVNNQDRLWFIGAVSRNSVATQLAYDYVEEKWDELYERFGSSYSLGSLVEEVTKNFNTDYELERVKMFIARKLIVGSVKNAFERSIERIRSNIRWKEKNSNKLLAALAMIEYEESLNNEENKPVE
jgi:aminopeptidase N